MRGGEIVGVTLDPPLELTAEVDAELAAEEHGDAAESGGGAAATAAATKATPGSPVSARRASS